MEMNSKYLWNRNKQKAAITRTTLLQVIEAFVNKQMDLNNNLMGVSKTNLNSFDTLMMSENLCSREISEPQLQILGVLKCLIETIMPENISLHSHIALPLYIEAIATIISSLPASVICQRAFLNILWQRLCPMLMWFLSNPKEERSLTSTSDTQGQQEGGADRPARGSATSVAPPLIWPDGLKSIYDIVIHLAYLVGPVSELRPMVESIFHQMLLYPPPNHRLGALDAVCRLLETPEGIFCIAGPMISIPSLANENGCIKPERSFNEPKKPDCHLLTIITDSIFECSKTSDQALVCCSTRCVNTLLESLATVSEGEGLTEGFIRAIETQWRPAEGAHLEENENQEIPTTQSHTDANLPRTLELDRWAAHNFLLSLGTVIPRLLDAQSISKLDEILLEFSSSYCKDLRSSVLGGVLSPTESSDFVDAPYDVNGTLLNADAVYVATFTALALNYRLLQAGFYSTPHKSTVDVMTEAEFLHSILGGGLLLYVSETWLSQVYRGVRSRDVLAASGLSPKLIHAATSAVNVEPSPRGSCLVSMLISFDGIGWLYDNADCQIDNEDWLETGIHRTQSLGAGQLIVCHVLHVAWDRIVGTLANALAMTGLRTTEVAEGRSIGQNLLQKTPILSDSGELSADNTPFSKSLLQSLAGYFLSGDSRSSNSRCQLYDLGKAYSHCLTSLQQMIRLVSKLRQPGLRARCNKVIALLTTATGALSTIHLPLHTRRIHSTQALSIDAILTNALEVGCWSPDCWVHLMSVCQLVGALQHSYFGSGVDVDWPPHLPQQNTEASAADNIQSLIQEFGRTDEKFDNYLSVEQTGIVLNMLSTHVDRIFDTAAELLALPNLIDFLYCLVQASAAELAAIENSFQMTSTPKDGSYFSHTVGSIKDRLLRNTKLKMNDLKGDQLAKPSTSSNSRRLTLFLDRIHQVILRTAQSPNRPLLHSMQAWGLVSQHLVDACCFSSRCEPSLPSTDLERLLVSQKAVACLYQSIVSLVTTRNELPYFCSNEMFCKPFEILLRLDVYNTELQDWIVSCISDLVVGSSSKLLSGWRPIFAALRSINIPFLLNEVQLSDGPGDEVSDNPDTAEICPKAKCDLERPSSSASPNNGRISAVLHIFETFISTDDLSVFCEIAVDCVLCLLHYLSTDASNCFIEAVNASSKTATKESAATSTRPAEVTRLKTAAILQLLVRFCGVLNSVWQSGMPPSPSFDCVFKSAKRRAYIVAGGPPQMKLLPSAREFASPILNERINGLTPWFSSDRLLEPNFQPEEIIDPDLWTLRSLDDIDQPSGVLHLYFLTLEGMLATIWDCRSNVYCSIFEEFSNLLFACIDQISGVIDAPLTRLTNGIESEQTVFKNLTVGASFAVFVMNHVLLPQLQSAIANFAATDMIPEKEVAFQNVDSELSAEISSSVEESETTTEAIGKLNFIVGETVSSVCSIIVRFQHQDNSTSNCVVGLNLMLHQCLRVLIDCISIPNTRLSRMATSCLRHLLTSLSPCMTVHQRELAIVHVQAAFNACLLPIHTLITIYSDRSKRSLAKDAGLQVANIRPLPASHSLRQLAMRLFQLPEQLAHDCINEMRRVCEPHENSALERPVYCFEFWIFPLCAHETDRPPLDAISLPGLVTSLLNIRLLINLIGEIALNGDLNPESPDSVSAQICLPCDDSSSSTVSACSRGAYRSPGTPTPDFLTAVPFSSCMRMLNCLSSSYTAFFDFDLCTDLKKIIQKLLRLPSPANLYQCSHMTTVVLQKILLRTVHGLAANYCAHLCETVKSTFREFDNHLSKLRDENFRRLPLQTQTPGMGSAFLSPLPWLKPFIPQLTDDQIDKNFALLIAGLSTHLTQFYLYLLHVRNKELSHPKTDSSTTGEVPTPETLHPGFSTDGPVVGNTTTTEVTPKRIWRRRNMLGISRILTIDASTATALFETTPSQTVDSKLPEDRRVQMTSLAETIATLPNEFLALSTASSPSSISNLKCVFTCNIARLIAVADHSSLREALATWFLHVVHSPK